MAKGDFKKKYNELMSTHDYRGLADLLRNNKYNSDEATNKAMSMADKFEEEADIADKLLEGATQKQKDAYSFIANGPTKSIDPNVETDYYSKSFSDGWNSMIGDDGNIHIDLSSNNYLDYFIEGSGISLNDFSKNGIKREGNGITIKSDNPNKISIYNGLKNISNRVLPDKNIYAGATYMPGGINMYTPLDIVFSDSKIKQGYQLMAGAVEEANDIYAELMSKTNPYILQTVVTGYMGEDDKQLQKVFSAGAMDLQTFKEARALLEEKYTRVLQTKSLSQYNVYSMNEDNNGSQLLQKLEDNILKSELDKEINLAISENRLHFSHASNGLMYGTMITIDERYDTKKNPMEEYPARRFFVQDLFKSEAENSLRQDTQNDAMLQYAKHQTYGHTYRFKDGRNRIEDWDGMSDSAIWIDRYGTKRVVGKADIINMIDDDIILKRLIDYYRRIAQTDKLGFANTKEGRDLFQNTNKNYSPEQWIDMLYEDIKRNTLKAYSAKYGDSNDYVKRLASENAAVIYNNISIF